jgi:probable phosphoglycerate mutase
MKLYCIRHGETEWSLSGQHTGATDVPLTDHGRMLAKRLRTALSQEKFDLVLVSPLQRARETCALAGLGEEAIVARDLTEWNYGNYEGLTPGQVQDINPGWLIFRDGCPGGEAPDEVGGRVDRVIVRVRSVDGDVAVFAHGHVLRTLAARWIGLPPQGGQHFTLETGTISILGFYHNVPAVKAWNVPLAG